MVCAPTMLATLPPISHFLLPKASKPGPDLILGQTAISSFSSPSSSVGKRF